MSNPYNPNPLGAAAQGQASMDRSPFDLPAAQKAAMLAYMRSAGAGAIGARHDGYQEATPASDVVPNIMAKATAIEMRINEADKLLDELCARLAPVLALPPTPESQCPRREYCAANGDPHLLTALSDYEVRLWNLNARIRDIMEAVRL